MKFRKIISLLLVFAFALSFCACGDKDTQSETDNDTEKETEMKGIIHAEIKIKDSGIIKLELYPEIAPVTVKNFVDLANKKFYDGLIFHRVIQGFMIQGGDPEGTGMGGPGYTIKGEFSSNGFENNLKHERGVISMARAMDPNSAGSQFFIMHRNTPSLDGDYAAFGRVIEGMDVVDKIASVRTDVNDRPLDDQVMEYVRITDK